MRQVCLSLGTNLGDRVANIEAMELGLRNILTGEILLSRRMETEPLGMPEGTPPFLNQILAGLWPHSPVDLLGHCLHLEQALGRTEKKMMKSRTADIDILLIEDLEYASADLVIPHAGLMHRRFCLEGLNDVVPGMVIPGVHKQVRQLHWEMSLSLKQQKIVFL